MPDSADRSIFCALPDRLAGERRSPKPLHSGAPTGLPILSTEPLNAAEREAIRSQLRALAVATGQLEAALEADKVAHALDALQWSVTAGQVAGRLAVELGRGR